MHDKKRIGGVEQVSKSTYGILGSEVGHLPSLTLSDYDPGVSIKRLQWPPGHTQPVKARGSPLTT